MIDNNKVVQALREVIDPSSGHDIISQQIVSDFKIAGNQISFSLNLEKADSKVKSAVYFACEQAVKAVYPDADLNVHMKAEAPKQGGNKTLPQIKNLIAVGSGKGGVGKSTMSLNLAMGLKAKGYSVGIMDADLYGPSIPTMLGITEEKPKVVQVYDKHKLIPIESNGLHAISIGNIIDPEQAVVLRGPRLGGIIKQFVYDCVWPELDFLIIDLPPGTGDIQLTLVQTLALTGAVMVTTPQEVAVADAIKATNMFKLPHVNVPILGIIENMSWFTPQEMPDKKYFIFGENGGKKLSKYADTMLLGQMPLIAAARASGDKGQPAYGEVSEVEQHFAPIVENFLKQLSLRHEFMAPTERVQIKQ
jgi:ATP-binding protein involved in chromosome partitioning